MTRRRKLILLLVLVPVALVGLLVVAVFSSAVQTFATRKVLADQGTVERVSVGTGGAEITGLVIEQPGVKISIPSFKAEVPLIAAAGGKIDLRTLVARGIEIDVDVMAAALHAAQNATPPEPESAPTPFDGILKAVVLPADLKVGGLDLAGVLRVTGLSPQPVTADFTLSGGGVSAGQEGKVVLTITVKPEGGSEVATTLTLSPALDAAGQLSALALALDATANGGFIAQPTSLRTEARIARDGAGETWGLRLIAADKALVDIDTKWAPGADNLPGRWKLDLTDADLKPFLASLPFLKLPSLKLAGAGALAVAGTERVTLSGDLSLAADQLEVLGLPALGPISVATNFDVDASSAEAKVNAFRLDVAAGSFPVLSVQAKQAFAYDLATQKIGSANAASELVSVRLLGVPAAWVAAFVPDLSLGSPVTGAWSVRPEGDGVAVDTTEPFVLNKVLYGPADAPLASFDSVQLDGLRLRRTSAGLEAGVEKLRLVAGGKDLVTVKLSATQKPDAPMIAHAEIRALLAALADQPVLRGQTRLSAGQALLIVDATVADTKKVAAELRITGLRAAGSDLPEVILQADVTQDSAGVVTAKLPLTVDNRSPKRASDIEFSATVTPGKTETRIVARLVSQILHVPDLEAFLAIAADAAPSAPPVEKAPEEAPSAKETGPAAGPLWAGTTGELDISLARIVYVPGFEIENISGRVALTKDAFSLEKLQLLLGTGGKIDLGGALRWLEATRSYTLAGDVKGTDVAVGPLLRALNPSAAVPLEGTYALSATVAGEGLDPGSAAAGAAADLKITGKQGVLRALNLDANKYAKAGSTVAGLAGLAGALSGNSELAKRGAQVTALNNVAREFTNLAYDEFSFVAKRGADGAVEIGELRLLSPKLKLVGTGGLKNLPDRSFLQQPLVLKLEMGARDSLARDLGTLDLLATSSTGESAADGYANLVEPVMLDGTLQKIGTDQLMRLLSRALGMR